MGKSPGKWIKTKLFGKKSSKSNLSKDTTLQKSTSISNDSMVISSPVPPITHTTEEHSELHKTSTNPTTEVARSTTEDNSITLQQAAIKAQTAFRGYSARKELSYLKATILLQAHIRGHLVRKQQLHTKGNSVISTKTESFPEQSQSELEKVKQSLRKITISMAASAPPPNPEPESEPEHVPEPEPKLESEPEPEPVAMNMESSGRESMKTRRRSSFPVKHEHVESVVVSSPVLPSYMAATESAKAKLRAQAVAEDGGENGFVRRHSLPSSTGKVSLQSPRVQKPLGNGKGWGKSNKAQVCAKDDKTVQTGWKR